MRELWVELSATMRRMRQAAGASLRTVELDSGVRRGTLSQFETAKARPNRHVVEWYDERFGGDGLLLSMFAEVRGAHGPAGTLREVCFTDGDRLSVVGSTLPFGAAVECGTALTVTWTLHNSGAVPWRHRRLERMGARAGLRLLSSAGSVPIPDCDPGDTVEGVVEVGVPTLPATYVAYWQPVDDRGRAVLPFDSDLSVHVVARSTP